MLDAGKIRELVNWRIRELGPRRSSRSWW